MAATVMELYGSKVFNEHEMRERLPSSTYKSLKATIEKGQPLDLEHPGTSHRFFRKEWNFLP